MNDNVKPLRPGAKVCSSTVEDVLRDLSTFVDKTNSRHYNPEYGVVVFKDISGKVCTHTLGEMTNIHLLGVLHCAQHMHVSDACDDTEG